MSEEPGIARKYRALATIHYKIASKLAEIEVKNGPNDRNVDEKCATLRRQLERTEAELTELHEELDPEDFRDVLRAILR